MRLRNILLILALAAGIFFIGGCTTQEKQGYSRIPQNRPADWERPQFR